MNGLEGDEFLEFLFFDVAGALFIDVREYFLDDVEVGEVKFHFCCESE